MSYRGRDYAVTDKEVKRLGEKFVLGEAHVRERIEKLALLIDAKEVPEPKTANQMRKAIENFILLEDFYGRN